MHWSPVSAESSPAAQPLVRAEWAPLDAETWSVCWCEAGAGLSSGRWRLSKDEDVGMIREKSGVSCDLNKLYLN